jgi:hypothetical protein
MNVPKRFRTDNFVIVFFLINRLLAHIIDYQTLLPCYQGSILLLLLSIFIMSVFFLLLCVMSIITLSIRINLILKHFNVFVLLMLISKKDISVFAMPSKYHDNSSFFNYNTYEKWDNVFYIMMVVSCLPSNKFHQQVWWIICTK